MSDVTVGTTKVAFFLRARGDRKPWRVDGPRFRGHAAKTRPRTSSARKRR